MLAGKDIGKRGTITRVLPDREQGDRHQLAAASTSSRSTRSRRARRCRAASSTRRCRSTSRTSRSWCNDVRRDAHRLPLRRRTARRSASAASAELTSDGRHEDRRAAARSSASKTRSRRTLQTELGLTNVMQVPRLDEDRRQHGCRPGDAAAFAARRRGHRPHDHHRPEADGDARRRSRSRTSSCARATRSAPR